MMDLLRGFAKGWTAKILIFLLIMSFAVWGISGSILGGAQYNVVEIGDTKVDAYDYRFAYESQLNALSNSVQRRLTRQEADALGLRHSVLSQLVSGAVLDENAKKMGLGMSDENLASEIASDPAFSDLTGNFSRTALRSALRQANMSEADYIDGRKRVAMRNQIIDGTAGSINMPATYSQAFMSYRDQQRVFDYVIIGNEVATELQEPSDTEISEFYEANKQQFVAPEYRKINILKVEASDLLKPDEVTEEELVSAYENRKANLRTPEKRQIEQLVVSDAETAAMLQDQLNAGKTFEEIVRSQGKSISDIDLGLFTKSELPDQKVADAAFAAELNKPTATVEGLFGPVILRVTNIEPESTTKFEDIKEELRNEIAFQRAGDEVFTSFDAIEDERGAGENLTATGKTLDFPVRTISMIDRFGRDENGERISDIPNLNDLVAQVFASEPGDDTQPLELGENGFLWFEVESIIPERQRPLTEVTEDVKDAWLNVEKQKLIEATADKIAGQLRNGEEFNAVLAETLPTDSLGGAVKFITSAPATRNAPVNDLTVNSIREGFAAVEGDIVVTEGNGNERIVLRVKKVVEPEAGETDQQIAEAVNQAASQDVLTQLVADLQIRENVRINQSAIDLAFSQ